MDRLERVGDPVLEQEEARRWRGREDRDRWRRCVDLLYAELDTLERSRGERGALECLLDRSRRGGEV